jgi:hypothetical protein
MYIQLSICLPLFYYIWFAFVGYFKCEQEKIHKRMDIDVAFT